MSTIKRNIDIIHNCEERFYTWLKSRLNEHGIELHEQPNLSNILEQYQSELISFKQLLKPLQKWNSVKDECFKLSAKLNGHADSDEYLIDLIEKTAFEGQILWLTFQEE